MLYVTYGVESTWLKKGDSGTNSGICESREGLAVGGNHLASLAWTTDFLVEEVELEVIVAGKDIVEGINSAIE